MRAPSGVNQTEEERHAPPQPPFLLSPYLIFSLQPLLSLNLQPLPDPAGAGDRRQSPVDLRRLRGKRASKENYLQLPLAFNELHRDLCGLVYGK